MTSPILIDIKFPQSTALGTIIMGEHIFPFVLSHRKNSRRLSLRVNVSHQRLHVTAPWHTSQKTITKFIASQAEWVLKHMSSAFLNPYYINDGTTLSILDEPHQFVFCEDTRSHFYMKNKEFIISSPHKENFGGIAQQALKNHAYNFFLPMSQKFAHQIGQEALQVKIKDYKSRWGTCSKDKVLTYSWRLLFAPQHVASYVCAHEVAHLQEMNHQKSFWLLVKELDPDYKASRGWLKKNGRSLFSYTFLPS